MRAHLKFWYVWGKTGRGEEISRRVFAQDYSEAVHRFWKQTGIIADGAQEG